MPTPSRKGIWSAQPVHEPLVTLEDWLQAQDISGHRFGSRSTSNTNVKHLQQDAVTCYAPICSAVPAADA